jgi:hypothetical protein
MLGRLGMTVDQCIRAYRAMAQEAFTPKRSAILPGSPSGAYSATALEAAIKKVVREYCVEAACVAQRRKGFMTTDSCPHGDMMAFRAPGCTKTYV